MDEQEPRAVAATVAAVPAVGARLRPRLWRGTAHGQAGAELRGQLRATARKNGGQRAEPAGSRQPRAIPRVLDRAVWDADAGRAERRASVVAALGEPSGVLVVAEPGLLQQGTQSGGGKRHDRGPAGRMEHGPIGGCLASASATGRAGRDRARSLPQKWAADPARWAAAGGPAALTCQPTPPVAQPLRERALAGGVPAAGVRAAAGSGQDFAVRPARQPRGHVQVGAVTRTHPGSTGPPSGPPGQARAGDRRAARPWAAWQRVRGGAGAPGERVADGACRGRRPAVPAGGTQALRARRHPSRRDDLACSLVDAPAGRPRGGGRAGRRHLTRARWALAILAAAAAWATGGEPVGDEQLVPLRVPERRRLLVRRAIRPPARAVAPRAARCPPATTGAGRVSRRRPTGRGPGPQSPSLGTSRGRCAQPTWRRAAGRHRLRRHGRGAQGDRAHRPARGPTRDDHRAAGRRPQPATMAGRTGLATEPTTTGRRRG